MGVMYEGILTEVPGITVENDTVIGWLEFEEVIELMNKIEKLESKNAYIN